MFDWKRSYMMLAFLGLLLQLTMGCSSSLRSHSEPKTTSTAPESKILYDKVAVIPSLDARLTKLVFFSSGPADVVPLRHPIYESRFQHAATTRVYPEIHLEYPPPGKKIYFTVTVHIRDNGKTFRIVDYETRIEPDWTSSDHSVGIGVLGPGNWRAGTYEADVYINGEKVAMGSFEVY
jgi:hypothetical protein